MRSSCSFDNLRHLPGAGAVVWGVVALTFLTFLGISLAPPLHAPIERHADIRSMLQHCSHVYVDCGTNVGIQIRKLYEPELFPKAKIRPHFDKYFGTTDQRRQNVCSFGFEPNSNHSAHLQTLERAYNDMGWRTRIFVETAIGPKPTTMYLKRDPNADRMHWGSRMIKNGAGDPIPVVGVVDFFRNALVWDDESEHVIVMKVDIEGMDTALLAELAFSGQLCRASFVYVEHFTETSSAELTALLKAAGCKTLVMHMDDETYYNQVNLPLPAPGSSPL
jgi:hypothetical protein